MTLAFRRRSHRRPAHEETAPTVPGELAQAGIHRDTSTDQVEPGGFAQRFANRVSAALAGPRDSRRGFLTKTAMVGSALAVGPIDFILKPGTAYGYLCGTCTDGWTAFCCTINDGRNSCPSGSFVAGWWKADNAAYCCGSARYIIDCNATCPTQCSCTCGGGSCDNRKVCCNQFRYGQCHMEISCYGPVVCRVATCVPPWQYDPSCTTTVRTDNRTTDHGAPCLTVDCGTPIARKYAALGGSAGVLGPVVNAEHDVGDGRGKRARYRNGNIYWTAATGAHEVRAGRLSAYTAAGGPTAKIGYPTTDSFTSRNGRWIVNTMERGRLFQDRQGTGNFYLVNPIFTKHQQMGGLDGSLGYPIENQRRAKEGRSLCQTFSNGRIYVLDWNDATIEIHGSIFRWHQKQGGVNSPWKYPITDLRNVPGSNRGRFQDFEGGTAWYTPTTGCHGLRDEILAKYVADGGPSSYLGYPRSSNAVLCDGVGIQATFESGTLFHHPTHGTWRVHGRVLPWYNDQGNALGRMGYPISDLEDRKPNPEVGRVQHFENGSIRIYPDGTIVEL